MNRKLKQQLKEAFEAPEPKRKQQFLAQIEKQTSKEQPKGFFLRLFNPKWICATSFSIGLILVTIFIKPPTIELDFRQKQCSCNNSVYIAEENITKTHLYSYSKCIICGEVKSRVEIVVSKETEFCAAEEILQPNVEIKLR